MLSLAPSSDGLPIFTDIETLAGCLAKPNYLDGLSRSQKFGRPCHIAIGDNTLNTWSTRMTYEDCNWQDRGDIEKWVTAWAASAAHKPLDFVGEYDPIDELRHRLTRGDFQGGNRISIKAFLEQNDAQAHRLSDFGKAEREERAIAAAERSADAAASAAKWAGWSIGLSLVALALSALPHLK